MRTQNSSGQMHEQSRCTKRQMQTTINKSRCKETNTHDHAQVSLTYFSRVPINPSCSSSSSSSSNSSSRRQLNVRTIRNDRWAVEYRPSPHPPGTHTHPALLPWGRHCRLLPRQLGNLAPSALKPTGRFANKKPAPSSSISSSSSSSSRRINRTPCEQYVGQKQ